MKITQSDPDPARQLWRVAVKSRNHTKNQEEVSIMKGSAKQIAWAEEIRANVIASFERFISDIKAFNAPEEVKTANIAGCQERIEALTAAEYAGDIIDLFKDIRFTGNNEVDFPKVMAVYRVAKANTPGEKEILRR